MRTIKLREIFGASLWMGLIGLLCHASFRNDFFHWTIVVLFFLSWGFLGFWMVFREEENHQRWLMRTSEEWLTDSSEDMRGPGESDADNWVNK